MENGEGTLVVASYLIVLVPLSSHSSSALPTIVHELYQLIPPLHHACHVPWEAMTEIGIIFESLSASSRQRPLSSRTQLSSHSLHMTNPCGHNNRQNPHLVVTRLYILDNTRMMAFSYYTFSPNAVEQKRDSRQFDCVMAYMSTMKVD